VFYGALSVHLGAFLLLRVSPLLDASPTLSAATVMLGLLTAGYATLVGRAQTDIKSILSFASVAQVGLIVAEIGLGWRFIPLVHLLGHACLRTLQFIRAPSFLQDRRQLEDALGDRVPTAGSGTGWVYRFALERGYLDAWLDRYVAGPFVRLFRWLDAKERAATAALAGPGPAKPQPAPTRKVEQPV
jgi:NAD(P)H-quinone oxidoreductase subunit 5